MSDAMHRFETVGVADSALPTSAPPAGNDLELPGWIWQAMAGTYGLFFAGLLFATGRDREALFSLVVSALYMCMYFGTSALLVGLKQDQGGSAFASGAGPLQTWTGPMEMADVAGQVLLIPACLALFGVGVAIESVFAR